MSKVKAPTVLVFILVLTLQDCPSWALHLDADRDYCTELVQSRFDALLGGGGGGGVAAAVGDFPSRMFFCHPSVPNAYLECVVGKTENPEGTSISFEVVEERELVCGANEFFNSDVKVYS